MRTFKVLLCTRAAGGDQSDNLLVVWVSSNRISRFRYKRFSIFPFLNLAISEMQETSHWPTHSWNVMSEQRKSNWQHPNTYYREREETQHSAADECDTSRHPHPYRSLPTKAAQTMADPGRDVILEAIHFLVEIGNPRHPRLSGMHSIRSCRHARRDPLWLESLQRQYAHARAVLHRSPQR
jgi:hypothetical protein